MQWLDKLLSFPDLGAMRADLAAKHPAFQLSRLTRLAIVGAADEGKRLAALCAKRNLDVLSIADDNPAVQGTIVNDVPVIPVDALVALPADTPVVIASHRVLKALDRLTAMGFANVAPFALLEILAPEAFAPHMFYAGWLEELFASRERHQALAGLWADDFSRRVHDAVIGYSLTADATLFADVVDWELYSPRGDFLPALESPVYIDAGAFDGDTIRLFIERQGEKFEKIYGFEPDPGTFARLRANFTSESRVIAINKGLYSKPCTLRFDNAGSRGSLLTESSGIEVPVTSIDETLQGERISMIKLNVEGAELEALVGAQDSIRRHAPVLAVSAYHLPDHLWKVPAAIRGLRDDYRLYLRQHDGGVIETVVYAVAKS